jgi:hypothetical protein
MPDDTDDEVTSGGSRVYRHEAKERAFEPATGDESAIEAISDHIEEYVGPVAGVFHEIISDKVHLDVHMVGPGKKRPFHTLVTSGMSDRPMTLPEGADCPRFAELCVLLPEDWKLSQKAFEKERWYWPVRWLKTLARLPHDYDTFLDHGHTVPNGDPPEPYADGTDFCCMLVARPVMFDKGFRKLKLADKTIAFYVLLPLYAEEVRLKLDRGTDELLDLFDEYELDDVIDLERPNVAKKRRR